MNPLENLPPFYVGQKVVARENYGDICKDETYVVKGIISHSCGCFGLNIGFYDEFYTATVCFLHNDSQPNNGVVYYNSKRFSPLTESPFPSLTYERVIKKESVLTSMN